jgi:double-stranded uracil-DNA glycosylase
MTMLGKPTKEDLENAKQKLVPDLIDYNLKILFCGINPGLYTAATGFHYARPGNRFWPALYKSGLTKELLIPSQQKKLLEYGYGMTNFVARPSNTATELSKEEFVEGAKILEKKVLKYKPQWLAVVGIGAYKIGFNRKLVKVGEQEERIGNTKIWVLPNPSGLNANYTPDQLAILFEELKNRVVI